MSPALQEKCLKVDQGFKKGRSEGMDLAAAEKIMQEFQPLLQQGRQKEVKAILDRALEILEKSER